MYNAAARNLDVIVTGDSLITRPLSPFKEPEFLELRELVQSADVAFTNLEVVLGEVPDYPSEYCGGNWLGVPPGLVDELTWMGFNLFSTANNHAGDFGTGGVLATLDELRKRQIAFAGTGETLTRAREPGYLDLDPGRVALIGVTATWPAGSAAGEQRGDVVGRPGVNPLHHKTIYRVTQESLTHLEQLAVETGSAAARADRVKLGYEKADEEGQYTAWGQTFEIAADPGTSTAPEEKDLAEILKWIGDAKRQAEFCFVSIHAHEPNIELTRPAQFVETFCRECVDAGADAVFGHGPHVLRGVELYHGVPILYSLGNFMMQSSTMQRLPADMYRRFDADPFHGTPADIFDNRQEKYSIRRDPLYYESVVTRLSCSDGHVNEVWFYPVHLGTEAARSQKGRPLLAHGQHAAKILGHLQHLSEPYGTKIEVSGEVGHISC